MEKKINEKFGNPALDLALDTINIDKQAIIFVNSKRSAEKTAEDISKKTELKSKELDELSEQILKALSSPTKQCKRLAVCVKKGIAFHHAGLNSKQKELVEDAFRDSIIKVIAATPTLALGVDLPAFRSIMKDLRRFTGRGLNWIPVLEYLQMSGRAGRPGKEDFGESISVCSTEAEKDEITKRYLYGVPEDVFSKLAVEPVLRTYLLSLIATNFVRSKKQIIKFFSKTFWAYQFKDMDRLQQIIEKMLKLLIDYEFITTNQDDFISASEIEDQQYKATLVGLRVAQLYVDPYTANYIIECMKRSNTHDFDTFSLLQMVSNTLEMRPLLKVRVKEYDDISEKLVGASLLCLEPALFEPEYEDFFNSVKTAMFMDDWVNEKDEEYMLEKYTIRPGEIKVKLDKADWLLYASDELASLLKLHDLIKHIKKLRLRIKYGVKEELLALLQLKDIGRVRARKLYKNNVKNLKDVKATDYSILARILSPKIAASIKEQVGQKIDIKNIKEKTQTKLF